MNELIHIFKRNNWKQNLSWFLNILWFMPCFLFAMFSVFVIEPLKKGKK